MFGVSDMDIFRSFVHFAHVPDDAFCSRNIPGVPEGGNEGWGRDPILRQWQVHN